MKLEQLNELFSIEKSLRNRSTSNPDTKRLETLYRNKIHEFYTASGKVFYQELEMSSDTIDIHEDISYDKTEVSLHSHDFFEILFCRSGNLQYLVGNTRYQLQKGDVVFVPPGVSHRPLFLEQFTEPYARTVIWVNADFYETCKQQLLTTEHLPNDTIIQEPGVLRAIGTLLNQIEQLFDRLLYEKKQNRPGNTFYCTGLFIQLLCLFYRMSFFQGIVAAAPVKPSLFDEIIQYIEDHLAEPISLHSISDAFHVSPSAISQLFKKQMDISFYKVVTQRRLIEAKNYIIAGTPMKEIPAMCGFTDYSVFYRAFTKEFGISPKQFQKR